MTPSVDAAVKQSSEAFTPPNLDYGPRSFEQFVGNQGDYMNRTMAMYPPQPNPAEEANAEMTSPEKFAAFNRGMSEVVDPRNIFRPESYSRSEQPFPGVLDPLYTPERMIGGKSMMPGVNVPFLPLGPPHTASNFEAAAVNMIKGFGSSLTSAKDLVGFMPPVFVGTTLASMPELVKRLIDAEKTPRGSQERWEAGMAMALTLFSAGFMSKAALNSLRRAAVMEKTPLYPQHSALGAPRIPAPAAVVQPGERGFRAIFPKAIPGFKVSRRYPPVESQEAVGPVVEQQKKEVPDAEQPSVSQVPPGQTEVRRAEGAGGEGQGAGDSDLHVGAGQGEEAGRQVPPLKPPKIEEQKQEPVEVEPVSKLTDEQLNAAIDKTRAEYVAGKAQPEEVFELLDELRRRQEEKLKPPPTKPEEKGSANRQPLSELLSDADRAKYQHLDEQWDKLELEGGNLLNDPTNPRAWEIADRQNQIRVKQREILRKLPDGDVHDVVVIGSGASGIATGIHGGAENLDTLVLEHSTGKGTASKSTGRYANVTGAPSPLGDSGARRELVDRLQATRMGTEFRTVSDIDSYSYDPKTKIYTIKTKGLGEGGGGGQTIKTRIIEFATGTRSRSAPFHLTDAEGKIIDDPTLGEKGRQIHIDNAAAMRAEAGPYGDMGAVGAANSSAQGATIEANKPRSGVFHIIARGPDLKSVSGYLLGQLRELQQQGKVKVHFDRTVDHVEAPSPKNGNKYVIVTRETPPHGKRLEDMPFKERIPVKSVGSFIGANPSDAALPPEFLKDAMGRIRTSEDLRPLVKGEGKEQAVNDEGEPMRNRKTGEPLMVDSPKLGPDGKPETVPGAFVSGTIRSAPGVNRMITSEGEGARAIAIGLGDLNKMAREGFVPAWKTELAGIKQRLGSVSEGLPPSAGEHVPPAARESRGKKGGPYIEAPPYTETEPVSPETVRKIKEGTHAGVQHAVATTTESQQKQQQQPRVVPPIPRPKEAIRETPVLEEKPPTAAIPTNPAQEAAQRLSDNYRAPDIAMTKLANSEVVQLDRADSMLVLQKRATAEAQMHEAGNRAMDKSLPAGERADAAHNYTDLDNQIRMMDEVTDNGELLAGDDVRAWHQFRARDYTVPAMERKMQIAKGGEPLTAAESAKIGRDAQILSDAMAQEAALKVRIGFRTGKPLLPPYYRQLRDIQKQAHDAKVELDNAIFKARFQQRNLLYRGLARVGQVADLSRAVMTSADLSAVLRQGGLIVHAHPLMAMRAIPDMLRAARSDGAYFDLMQDIRERPNSHYYVSSKLGLTEIKTPKFSQMEEMYGSQWADKIPIVGSSQRAYVYFLNRLRADMFDKMSSTLPKHHGPPTADQAWAISNYVNEFTGRGRTPESAAGAMHLLNQAFFAPRWTISRFQVLYGDPLWVARNAPGVRAMIAQEYARALTGYALEYALVYNGLKQLGVDIEVDPRSSDWLSFKIGDTRWNPLSGLTQPAVFMARTGSALLESVGLMQGSLKTPSGKITSLVHPKYGERSWFDIAAEFGRGRLAPMPSMVANGLSGEKVTGEKTTWTKELLSLMYPITVNDIYGAIKAFGLPVGAALALMALFGDNVNTYATKPTGVKVRKPHKGVRKKF